jgi:hypothetical protein
LGGAPKQFVQRRQLFGGAIFFVSNMAHISGFTYYTCLTLAIYRIIIAINVMKYKFFCFGCYKMNIAVNYTEVISKKQKLRRPLATGVLKLKVEYP